MSPPRVNLAAAGFAQGDRYDRARPGYPAAAIEAVCVACGIGPGRRVLDLAAGTGKLTRALLARGADVVAVEPVAGMRDQLAVAAPGALILDGTAERLPLEDASIDAATVAQAFHWFEGPAALGELHRVLVPGGTVGLMWNVMDRSVPWVGRLQDLIHRHRGSSPWYAGHEWRSAFAAGCGFSPLEHRVFANAQPVDAEGVVDRVASISFIATLPDTARTGVLAEVRSLVADVQRNQPLVQIPYVTDVFWSHRVG